MNTAKNRTKYLFIFVLLLFTWYTRETSVGVRSYLNMTTHSLSPSTNSIFKEIHKYETYY